MLKKEIRGFKENYLFRGNSLPVNDQDLLLIVELWGQSCKMEHKAIPPQKKIKDVTKGCFSFSQSKIRKIWIKLNTRLPTQTFSNTYLSSIPPIMVCNERCNSVKLSHRNQKELNIYKIHKLWILVHQSNINTQYSMQRRISSYNKRQ